MNEPMFDLDDPATIILDDSHHVRFNDTPGLVSEHKKPDGDWHVGGINFKPTGWTLVSREPLTVTPSLLCDCGDHGFITDGKWVPA